MYFDFFGPLTMIFMCLAFTNYFNSIDSHIILSNERIAKRNYFSGKK